MNEGTKKKPTRNEPTSKNLNSNNSLIMNSSYRKRFRKKISTGIYYTKTKNNDYDGQYYDDTPTRNTTCTWIFMSIYYYNIF